ncbi:MAG: type II toxin-antitoxin system RelE/ParE family toxin [Nitrospinae bacterium]|nr:type II toxin-antitoxin system RelE/ParE family toxin [Nitrospinota bacterium]
MILEEKEILYDEFFEIWFDDLKDQKAKSIILTRLGRLRLGNLGECKSIGEGIHELVIEFGPGYRVYFGNKNKKLVIILAGSTKKNQQKMIDAAKDKWKIIKSMKR